MAVGQRQRIRLESAGRQQGSKRKSVISVESRAETCRGVRVSAGVSGVSVGVSGVSVATSEALPKVAA